MQLITKIEQVRIGGNRNSQKAVRIHEFSDQPGKAYVGEAVVAKHYTGRTMHRIESPIAFRNAEGVWVINAQERIYGKIALVRGWDSDYKGPISGWRA